VPHVVIGLDSKRRVVVPPGLVEAIVAETPTSLTYTVENPSWATLYPALRHRGDVVFERSAPGAAVLRWRVDVEPRAGDRLGAWWLENFTALVVGRLADDLVRRCRRLSEITAEDDGERSALP